MVVPHFSIHSSVDVHLCYFAMFDIVSSVAINIQVQIFVLIPIFNNLGYIYLGEELLGHMLMLCLTF